MRTEELVSRANQEIAVEGAHVNRAVRSVVDGIDITQCSRLPRQPHHFGDVVDRAYGIRRITDGHQARALSDFRGKIVHVERAIILVELHGADDNAFFFQRFPGREVRVVVKQCEDDLVAGCKFPPDRSAHRESQSGHICAEHDFIRSAIQKITYRRPRFRDHAVSVAAGLVSAAGVGVVAREIVRDGVNHLLRHLRATRAIQKNRGMSADCLGERGELRANPGEVECGG